MSKADVIEAAILVLSQGRGTGRVRLAELRERLPLIAREVMDIELIGMQRSGQCVLYRENKSAALSKDDHDAALVVGDSPRHLVLLI